MLEEGAHHGPLPLDPLLVPMLRPERDQVQPAGPAEPELRVGAGHAAVHVEELAVGDERPDVRLRVEVVARPANQHPGVLAVPALAGVVPPSRRLVVGRHHPEGRVPHLAGQLGAQVRVDEGARVHEVDGRGKLEDLGPLQEEGPQLGEEEGEPLVDLDLRQVGLDLREVGVAGEVGGQVRRDAVLDVQAHLGVRAPVDQRARAPIEQLVADGGERRQDLEVAAGGEVGHALEHAHLPHEALHVARHRGPDHVLLILPLDLPHDLEPPAVLRAGRSLGVAEALERDGHLRRVAVLDDLRAAVEQGVPRTGRRRGSGRPGSGPR